MRKYWAVAGFLVCASSGRLVAAPEPVDPKPRIDLATLFGPDAYPPLATTLEEAGTVVAALAIDQQGAVTECRIATSSGSTSLDAATCRIMMGRKTSFSPARDAAGKSIAGSYELNVRWILPEASPSPLESVGQQLTLLLSNKAVIKRCELRNMPGNVAMEAVTMCAGFREMMAAMFGGDPETSPPGDAEVLVLIDRTVGQAAPLSGQIPAGMTIVYDVGSEFVVQPDGRRTDCTTVITLVDASFDDDGKDLGFCERNETFAKHLGAPIKVQDRARIAYRLAAKAAGT